MRTGFGGALSGGKPLAGGLGSRGTVTGGAAPPPPESSLLTGLIAAWNLDDLTDASGNGHTLTGANSPTFNTGKIGNAMYLASASSQYAKIVNASAGDLIPGDNDFSIVGWFYMTSLPTIGQYVQLIGFGPFNSGVASAGFVGVINIGVVQLCYQIGQQQQITAIVSSDAWHFVALSYDNSTGEANAYFDSVTPASVNIGSVTASSSSDFGIGSHEGARLLNGRADAGGMWSRVLTVEEISELYNGGAGKEYPFAA